MVLNGRMKEFANYAIHIIMKKSGYHSVRWEKDETREYTRNFDFYTLFGLEKISSMYILNTRTGKTMQSKDITDISDSDSTITCTIKSKELGTLIDIFEDINKANSETTVLSIVGKVPLALMIENIAIESKSNFDDLTTPEAAAKEIDNAEVILKFNDNQNTTNANYTRNDLSCAAYRQYDQHGRLPAFESIIPLFANLSLCTDGGAGSHNLSSWISLSINFMSSLNMAMFGCTIYSFKDHSQPVIYLKLVIICLYSIPTLVCYVDLCIQKYLSLDFLLICLLYSKKNQELKSPSSY
ncbi:hypothetical protein FF38_04452 [Lucilia cuprina]|uniref:Uncharacterized protein n=1 Tax=Lucilia cuprina TaxID=7375 RepID=A0A0L0CRE2_LUCCU|nr:hypothetical protein FF38_04452 [Lucilia cuprina]